MVLTASGVILFKSFYNYGKIHKNQEQPHLKINLG